MRNFRKAALAGAIAVAVALGSTSVAVAETAPTPEEQTQSQNETSAEQSSAGESEQSSAGESSRSLSSQIGKHLGAWQPGDDGKPVVKEENLLDGTALFGSSKEGFEKQPAWGQALYIGTILAAVAGVLGMVAGPIYNTFIHGF